MSGVVDVARTVPTFLTPHLHESWRSDKVVETLTDRLTCVNNIMLAVVLVTMGVISAPPDARELVKSLGTCRLQRSAPRVLLGASDSACLCGANAPSCAKLISQMLLVLTPRPGYSMRLCTDVDRLVQ